MSVYSIPPRYGGLWCDMLSQSHAPGDWFQGATDDRGDDNGNQRETGVPYRGNALTRAREDNRRYVRPCQVPIRTAG